ncbi:hypothetical protein ACFYWY_14850 [Streptomyces sp. NPDC002870]|uniref:hypothetical protein n=1 Tax=Streptomyces sp. NPDC002870 TaxID=3364666 RepID=UPI0036C2C507
MSNGTRTPSRNSIPNSIPFFNSLAHARTALAHSNLGDRQAAVRSLGHAQEALAKASLDEPPPSWVAFYGPAELTAVNAIGCSVLGMATRPLVSSC